MVIDPEFLSDPTLVYMHEGDLCLEYRFQGGQGICVRTSQLRYAIYTLLYNRAEHVWEPTFLKYMDGDDLPEYLNNEVRYDV
jgi:hypothetical protein